MTSNPPSLVSVFGIIFNEGERTPAFQGVTQIPLPKRENMFRRILRASHPNARKVALTILDASTVTIPDWFVRCSGRFLFPTKAEIALAPAKPTAKKKKAKKKARR